MLNYYQVLEIPDFSSDHEIKKAFRAKCRQYHPDLVNNLGAKLKSLAEKEMAIVNKAFEVLGDPKTRLLYDAWLRAAGKQNSLKPCRTCGLHYAPDPDDKDDGICSECNRASSETTGGFSEGAPISVEAEKLLKNCFVALHHFVSAMSLYKFIPALNLVVSGERMKVSGPPGLLEVMLFNKDIYNLVQADTDTVKHPWHFLHKLGKITFPHSHPVQAAAALWDFCNQALGNPQLEYCRISIAEENHRSYEHILNQSVLITIAELSPWTASRLFARHQGNLVEALNDPEAGAPDPFFTVMAATDQKNDESQKEIEKLRRDNRRLEAELLASRQAHFNNNSEQAADILPLFGRKQSESNEEKEIHSL